MSKTIKVALARRRRLRRQAPGRHQEHRRRGGDLADRPRARQDAGSGRQVRHRPPSPPISMNPWRSRSSTLSSSARPRRCTPSRAWPASRRASTCRWRFRWPTASRVRNRWWTCRSTPVWWPCAATRAASTPATSTCTRRSRRVNFNIQQMDVQTYFFRRTNTNALGQARSWTDHLLWHHAAHTVDLFAYQANSPIVQANAVQGPIHPTLGIAMDMSIQLKAANGAICTPLALFQQRRPARHLLPLHRRHRDLHRALRRPVQRQGREDRRLQGGREHERHRAAGSRVLRRHPRRPRTEFQRGPCVRLLRGCCTSWSSNWHKPHPPPRFARPPSGGDTSGPGKAGSAVSLDRSTSLAGSFTDATTSTWSFPGLGHRAGLR